MRECTFLLIISVDTFCRDGSEKEVYKEQTMHSNADVTDQALSSFNLLDLYFYTFLEIFTLQISTF